jgi:ATP dependent DNA ligase domain
MPRTFEFCIPSTGTKVPSSPEWFHEIKYDGFRMRVERDVDRVRLITRGGYDWTKRFPWIAEAVLKNRQKAFRRRRRGCCSGLEPDLQFQRIALGQAQRGGSALCDRCVRSNI